MLSCILRSLHFESLLQFVCYELLFCAPFCFAANNHDAPAHCCPSTNLSNLHPSSHSYTDSIHRPIPLQLILFIFCAFLQFCIYIPLVLLFLLSCCLYFLHSQEEYRLFLSFLLHSFPFSRQVLYILLYRDSMFSLLTSCFTLIVICLLCLVFILLPCLVLIRFTCLSRVHFHWLPRVCSLLHHAISLLYFFRTYFFAFGTLFASLSVSIVLDLIRLNKAHLLLGSSLHST